MAKAQISAEKIKETREAGGKRMLTVKQGLAPGKAYAVAEAVKILKDRAKAKFDETIEVAVNLGVDPKHADQMVRGVCNLPNGSGRTARVAAVSSSAIVVADTANPTGGFTDAEYTSFATTFDTLINALDVSNFGQPTDIDKNGKIIILFTKDVNLLTPRGSAGVIGGFFFERDLFPLSDTGVFGGCAGSNFAEMFYVLVPDPNHVYGDARSKQKVLDLTPGTLAHEYQHLINAGRRMYVNLPFNDFEEVWLNEGLSHMAEELLYYRVSGNAPVSRHMRSTSSPMSRRVCWSSAPNGSSSRIRRGCITSVRAMHTRWRMPPESCAG